MKRRQPHDVCAAVISDLQYDARVWKEVRSLATAGYRVKLVGSRFDLRRLARRREGSIDVVEVPFGFRNAKKSKVRRALTVLRVWSEVLGTSADVYHAHDVHVAPPAWLSSRLRGGRLVYDAHEIYSKSHDGRNLGTRLSGWAGVSVERFMVRRSDLVITTNESRAKVLGERHGARHVQVLANVPPRTETVMPLDPGYPKGKPILLYQGWISPLARAFRETVRALALVEDLHFVILGFGYESSRETIRRWAEEERVRDRVHFLPPRPFDELVRTAAAATIGLVPIKAVNLNTYLGDTNKIHEYLMAGLPIAASDLPEIRRLATAGDPQVGEVFDPTSPEDIAAALGRILDDPERYEARRREARRLALERFNWQIEEGRLLAAYASIGVDASVRRSSPNGDTP